jgi:hypothetical protein
MEEYKEDDRDQAGNGSTGVINQSSMTSSRQHRTLPELKGMRNQSIVQRTKYE